MNEHFHLHNCGDLLGQLGDYFEGELPSNLCEELEKHLRECDECRIVVNTMRKTIELYREDAVLHDEAPPDGVKDRLFYRLHLDEFLAETESGDSSSASVENHK